jgi:hypothetical protein
MSLQKLVRMLMRIVLLLGNPSHTNQSTHQSTNESSGHAYLTQDI